MTVFYPFKASLIFNVCDYAMQICFISIAATKQTVSEKNVFSGKAEWAIRHTVVFVWFSHFFFEKEHDYFSRLKQRKHFIIMPKRYPCF